MTGAEAARRYRRRKKAQALGVPVERVVMQPERPAFAEGVPAPRLKGRKFSLHLDEAMYQRIRMVGVRHGSSFNETVAMLCEWGLEEGEEG
jgi:hypothetical protein